MKSRRSSDMLTSSLHTTASSEDVKLKNRLSSEPYRVGVHHDVRYKVVLIGNSMVGKSSLLRCWRGDPFEPCLMPTVGLDFCGRVYTLNEGRLRLDVWDTAGQERYGSITSVHYRDAKGFIFVYDITDCASFLSLRRNWLNTVDEHLTEAVPIFVVGNKTDLSPQRRQVSTEEGRRFAELQSASGFYETSARSGSGVLELFYEVAWTMGSTWGLLRLVCEGQEVTAGAAPGDQCTKCGRKHKRRGIRLRATTLKLEGKNGMKGSCCGGAKTV